ncbi:MAG: HAMP domain-containing histidine kinase, partial [Clostridia bacterium]|nr:HAMP domain-containing histidine kinase [Clostridia bacterium]
GGDMSARMEPQEYHDEISELSENINYMADELSSTDKMKNDFISTVSHEMKTPLTAIKGWAETLQTVGDSDPALTQRGMEVIIDEATRLTGVVEDLLDLSKIVNGRMTLRYEKIDILAELDDTIFVFKDRSMREGIELIYNVPHVPAPAEGDPNRINQVFVNILDNAFKYTEQGGKITVLAEMLPPETEGEKSTLRVFVEDTGCGISKEELPKIRKKFYKSNISVRGSGIGLAVVDEIVKMHGGTMDIRSEVGVGTCVILSFPVDYVAPQPELETENTQIE